MMRINLRQRLKTGSYGAFMKKLISVRLAGNMLIVLMVFMIILHILIMLRIWTL